ncbi:LAMI_0E05842g1_1 [Lachancea mirantina]|uniref:LAMI_0E05842g1_1 n=1 Tax=Lachancea mirantina TaxID=1230905 RepID=A0A1G4JLD9_9SACH|nr:LAMI_0E05842g1_1 [Lachancea mirantina]
MKVRKRTSKRTSTRMKEGIKKKAAAHNRKLKKLAKKDPTWKSRVKKDPGIPANFPYKGKILEAIEARKQQEIEEKEAERQRLQEARKFASEQGEGMMEEDMEGEDMEDGNGLGALVEAAQQAAEDFDGESGQVGSLEDAPEVTDYDVDFFDGNREERFDLEKSRKAYDKVFKTVVDASDVVLYVLDARDPEGTRSRKVEQTVLQNHDKRLILILNKVDLVPPHVLEQWLNFLKSSFPTIPLRAAPGATNASSFNKKLTQATTSGALLEALKTYANNANFKRSIVVGVIGYPNVGKSSVINSLTARRGSYSKVCPVGNQAGVTTSLREVKIDNKLKILDSPGICFPGEIKKKKSEQEAELALLNALPQKFITDPYPAVLLLVKRLSKSEEMTSSFKSFYEIPPIPAPDADSFTKQFLIHVARKRGRIGKGGIPNLNSAGLSVLSDWRDGKILGWVMPKASKDSDTSTQGTENNTKVAPSVNQSESTSVVSEWSKEFDLDGLFSCLDNAVDSSNKMS